MNFFKYSSTGNDFIMIENLSSKIDASDKNYWQKLCHRRLSIGADGVIFLENGDNVDFHMRYLNADGAEVSMCGNGARAVSHFFNYIMKPSQNEFNFSTSNGVYSSSVFDDYVWVNMTEAYDIQNVNNSDLYSSIDSYYMNTGVPHCIYLVDDVEKVDVVSEGRRIRNQVRFKHGVNVNFISKDLNGYKVRTYERGVEDETLSCGTGITASAHFLWNKEIENSAQINFLSRGGELAVKKDESNILFGGETKMIYKGKLC